MVRISLTYRSTLGGVLSDGAFGRIGRLHVSASGSGVHRTSHIVVSHGGTYPQ